jgi:hypothetical protein
MPEQELRAIASHIAKGNKVHSHFRSQEEPVLKINMKIVGSGQFGIVQLCVEAKVETCVTP